MKLKEAILDYSGEWVYVGAASGYVYIGRREEALKELEKESIERYCNLSINTIPKYEAKMEWVTKRCKVLKEKAKTDIAFEKIYKNTEEYKKSLFLHLEEAKNTGIITSNLVREKLSKNMNRTFLNLLAGSLLSGAMREKIGFMRRKENE